MARRITLVSLTLLFLSIVAHAEDFCFEEAGNEYGIAPELLQTISKHESNNNPASIHYNKNGSYDYGLMQINSSWYKVLGPNRWNALADPCTNIKTGAWILAQCIQRYGETWEAVGCYNATTHSKRAVYIEKIKRVLVKIQKETREEADKVMVYASNEHPSDATP